MEQETIIEPEFICRICQDDTYQLILPCMCKTTRVHRECLQKWRYTDPTGERFYKCEICKYPYKLSNKLGKCSIIAYCLSVFSLFTFYISVFISTCFSISLAIGYIFTMDTINKVEDKFHTNEIVSRFLLGFSVFLCIIGAIGLIVHFRDRGSGCFIVEFDACFGLILGFIFFIFGIIIGIYYSINIISYFFIKAQKITGQYVHTNIWYIVDLNNENNIDVVTIDVVTFHQDKLDDQLL